MNQAGILVLVMVFGVPSFAQSVVPIRAIRAEQVVRPSDISAARDSWPGAISQLEDAIGREARVTLYPGRPILQGDLAERAVVDRNQIVLLNYSTGGLAIIAEGRALSRGRPGERIRAMNVASRMTIWGTVQADGTLEVSQ